MMVAITYAKKEYQPARCARASWTPGILAAGQVVGSDSAVNTVNQTATCRSKTQRYAQSEYVASNKDMAQPKRTKYGDPEIADWSALSEVHKSARKNRPGGS
ncbi:MAG: hypothetical protein HY661_14775 [Betaproteobacteria bacterium]|nr:hypothetical protein [Betaproteobacteria bacterium]